MRNQTSAFRQRDLVQNRQNVFAQGIHKIFLVVVQEKHVHFAGNDKSNDIADADCPTHSTVRHCDTAFREGPVEDCLFCKIASGTLPAHIVHEDDEIMAFLDLHPIRKGHALIIPKAHYTWFEDLPAPLATRITSCAQALARSMKRLYKVERVAMFYTGIHIPHAHAHVVPMFHIHDVTSAAYLRDGLDKFSTPAQLPASEMAEIAAGLRAATRS
ncbi:MAG: HIT family protein [Rhodobacteraceae bacterium]|nr:MAG: HIT family protein [Paracoccaceae bacterium]